MRSARVLNGWAHYAQNANTALVRGQLLRDRACLYLKWSILSRGRFLSFNTSCRFSTCLLFSSLTSRESGSVAGEEETTHTRTRLPPPASISYDASLRRRLYSPRSHAGLRLIVYTDERRGLTGVTHHTFPGKVCNVIHESGEWSCCELTVS